MLTSIVIDHFGTKSKIALALGIGKAAVSKWGERVPPLQAARLAQLTRNKLRFNAAEYSDWYSRKRVSKDQPEIAA